MENPISAEEPNPTLADLIAEEAAETEREIEELQSIVENPSSEPKRRGRPSLKETYRCTEMGCGKTFGKRKDNYRVVLLKCRVLG